MTLLFAWLLSNALAASLIGVVALAVSKAWPRRPALAHACWLLVLIKLLTPPLYVFPFSLPAGSVAQASTEAAVEPPATLATVPSAENVVSGTSKENDQEIWDLLQVHELTMEAQTPTETTDQQSLTAPDNTASTITPPPVPPVHWSTVVMTLWTTWGDEVLYYLQLTILAGMGLLSGLTVVRVIRFERLLQLTQPASAELAVMTKTLADTLQLKHVPAVMIVPGKIGPLLWRRWNDAVIVLPEGLLNRISREELETVLAHELTHYRRGDHLWRYLELAAVTVYWWLPSAWWASRRLRQAEEECCDAGVVASLPDGVASYATALVRSLTFVAEPSSPCPALSSGLGPVTLLKRRLNMLHNKVERKLGIRGWLMMMAVAAVALPIGISWADDDPPPSRRDGGRRGEDVRRDDARPNTASTRATNRRDSLPPADSDDHPAPPSRPVPPRGAGAPTAPAGAVPLDAPRSYAGVPPTPGQPAGQGNWARVPPPVQGGVPEDMRSAAEDAVKQAEIDLKIRKMKVRASEASVSVYSKEVTRNESLVKQGAVSSADINLSRDRLEQAKIDVELARLGVEQGELNLEQAKRRLNNLNRAGQQPGFPSQNIPPGGAMYGPTPGAGTPFVSGRASTPAPGSGAFGGGAAATGPAGGSGRGPVSRNSDDIARTIFDNMDRERKGKLSREDLPGFWRERMSELDTSKDGFVTFDEFKANREKLSGRPPMSTGGGLGGGPGGLGGPGGPGGVAGPGFAPGAGGIARSGGMPGGGIASADPFFRNFDRQNSGRIRREDVPEWMRERFFEMVDSNRDGVVDHDEFSANYGKLWETSRPGRGNVAAGRGGPGGPGGAGAGRGEGRGEAGRGGDAAPSVTRPRGTGERDHRDDRIEQLEKELRDMRKALEDLRKRDPGNPR